MVLIGWVLIGWDPGLSLGLNGVKVTGHKGLAQGTRACSLLRSDHKLVEACRDQRVRLLVEWLWSSTAAAPSYCIALLLRYYWQFLFQGGVAACTRFWPQRTHTPMKPMNP